jgi:hypothetical protein
VQIYAVNEVTERTTGLFDACWSQTLSRIGLPVLAKGKTHNFFHGWISPEGKRKTVALLGKQKAA